MAVLMGGAIAGPALAADDAARAEASGVAAGATEVSSDFNGDGYSDLAISVPGETYRNYREHGAGRVVILYGSTTGLTAGGSQSWTQISNGIAYTEYGVFEEDEMGDEFGEAIATGDFDDDGFADLAIGAPGEHPIGDSESSPNATGAVHILYGSPSGLKGANEIRWPADLGLTDEPLQFGSALAGDDFDGDGVDDLAIVAAWSRAWNDAPEDKVAVVILPGTPAGLAATPSTVWSQPSEAPWGNQLASGDLDADGIDDIALGIPRAEVSGIRSAGLVRVLFGDADGIGARNVLLTQNMVDLARLPGDADGASAYEHFGEGLAIGEFDSDGYGDLAIGAPGEGVRDLTCLGTTCQGAVTIVPGAGDGLDVGSSVVLAQGFDGLAGSSERGDAFGRALATGDVNRDGWIDLAVGAPGESVDDRCPKEVDSYPTNGMCGHGAVTVVYGSANGLVPARSKRWTLATPDVPGRLSPYARFGRSLAVAPFGRSRAADLAIGVPAGGGQSSGFVDVLYGRTSGLSATRAQLWSQDSTGVPGSSDPLDYFGTTLGQ